MEKIYLDILIANSISYENFHNSFYNITDLYLNIFKYSTSIKTVKIIDSKDLQIIIYQCNNNSEKFYIKFINKCSFYILDYNKEDFDKIKYNLINDGIVLDHLTKYIHLHVITYELFKSNTLFTNFDLCINLFKYSQQIISIYKYYTNCNVQSICYKFPMEYYTNYILLPLPDKITHIDSHFLFVYYLNHILDNIMIFDTINELNMYLSLAV